MQRFFPFLQWLPKYKRNYFPKDIVGGLTTAIVLIPQGMAYAMIAGLPPVYGLYASLFPLLVYAFLGTSRQLALGPVAMDSLLVAAGLSTFVITGGENYVAMAILLALSVGTIQLFLGIFRMGFLVNFLSKPVISGFTSGAAIIIIFSQLKHILGISIDRSNQLHKLLVELFEKLPETNIYDLAIGLLGILFIIILKKWSKRIPAILLVVVLGIVVVYSFHLEPLGIQLVGAIPKGLPSFAIPQLSWNNIAGIGPIALTLALVGYIEAVSIGKGLEEKSDVETVNANQELIALGTSNIVGSFFQSYPVTGSFSRSAINYESGAKTTVASLFTVAMVIITLLFLTPLFYYLPKAVLASIIMVSVVGLVDIGYPKQLWKYRKDEFIILGITFLITLFVGIPQGILFGVLLSLLIMVYQTSKPHFAILGNIKGTEYYKNVDRFGEEISIREDLLIVRFDAQLYFGNAAYFKKKLLKYIAAKGNNLRGVILNAEAINYIDSTAAKMLMKVIKEVHHRNIQFYIAGAIGPARDIIFSSDLIEELGKEFLFVGTKEAVTYFDDPTTVSAVQEWMAYQNQLRR